MKNIVFAIIVSALLISCKKEESVEPEWKPKKPTASEYEKYPVDLGYRILTTASSYTATYTILSGFNAEGAAIFKDTTNVFNINDTTIHITTIKYPYEKYHYNINITYDSTSTSTIYMSIENEVKCYRPSEEPGSNFCFFDY